MHSFWHNLPRPIIVLAPLADVTDAAFRRVIAKYSAHARADGTIGGPDVTWTEFVSADGLVRATEEGRVKLMADLMYSDAERPIVAQLFSAVPEHMEAAARLCRELGFDGVDINMGCPDRSIEKQGCGSAMIKNPENARAIIRAAKKGAGDLPVSVKTRLGYNQDELETWLPELLAEDPAVVTIHARTRKEMSKVPARWERIARAVEIRDEQKSNALIFGNGDATGLDDAHAKAAETGADGVMLGRAIFGNPWLFADFAHTPCGCKIERPLHTSPQTREFSEQTLQEQYPMLATQSRNRAERSECVAGVLFCEVCGGHYIEPVQKLCVMVEHTHLFEELLPHKNFAIMKKHYKAYVNGFDGARELRGELMEAPDAETVADTVDRFLAGNR